MTRRRQFGSVRKLPSGRWQARYTGPDGRRHRATDTFATRGDASRWLSAQETAIGRGAWADPKAGEVRLRTYALDWLDGRGDLRLRTEEVYRHSLTRHVLPVLGDYPIAKITPAHVRTWHGDLSRTIGPTAVRQAYAVLRTVLNVAVRDGVLIRNPCQIVGAGSAKAPERPLLSPADVAAIAAGMPENLRALVLLALWAGTRMSELFPLTRDHLDLERGTVRIDRAQVETKTAGARIEDPKTERGLRTVHLPPHFLPVLKDHLERFAGPVLVFVDDDGRPLRYSPVYYQWKKARTAVGLTDAHPHDLRHAGLTLAAVAGATLAELQHRAGHASSRAAMIYQHAASDRDAVIAAALSELSLAPSPTDALGTQRARGDRSEDSSGTS